MKQSSSFYKAIADYTSSYPAELYIAFTSHPLIMCTRFVNSVCISPGVTLTSSSIKGLSHVLRDYT